MNIIVIGMGEVGKHIAQILAIEFHNVIIVDSSQKAISTAEEKMDIMALSGHGASPKTLKQAEVHKADLLIAVTNNDEVNILAANLAREMGCKKTIARVSNPEFLPKGRGFYHDYIGVNLIVNPNVLTAIELLKLIKSTYALSTYNFVENAIQLVEFPIHSDFKYLSAPFFQLKLPEDVTIAALIRDGELIYPSDDDTVELNDHLLFIGNVNQINKLENLLELKKLRREKRVYLAGGTDISVDIAKELIRFDIKSLIIEPNAETAVDIAEMFQNKVNVIQADSTVSSTFDEIEFFDTDLFIALDQNDERNLISALLAKEKGCKKVILLAQKKDNLRTFEQLGLDVSISPRLLAANQILRFIQNPEIPNVYALQNGEYEVIEVVINEHSRVYKKQISEVNLPIGARLLCVNKQSGAIEYDADDPVLESGDHLIILLKTQLKQSVEKLFRRKSLAVFE